MKLLFRSIILNSIKLYKIQMTGFKAHNIRVCNINVQYSHVNYGNIKHFSTNSQIFRDNIQSIIHLQGRHSLHQSEINVLYIVQ